MKAPAFITNWLGITDTKKRGNNSAANRRSYAAAHVSRLTADFNVSNISPDSDLVKSLIIMRARSRQLAKSDDYYRRWIGLRTKNVVGPQGIGLKSRAVQSYDKGRPVYDAQANSIIETWWADACKRKNWSVTRNLSCTAFLNLVVETRATDGECFIRMVRGFDNEHGYAEQIIPADCLDVNYNLKLDGDKHIRMGVEMDEWGAPAAYHFFKRNPVDWLPGADVQRMGVRERIPASDIIHLFTPHAPGQTRGIPHLFSAIMRINHLNRYEEAIVIGKRIAAAKMGWIEEAPGDNEFKGDGQDAAGRPQLDVEPGTLGLLRSGEKVHQLNYTEPADSFESFHRAMLRGVAASGDVSHHALTGDLSQVNYSSARIGRLDEQDSYTVDQVSISEDYLDRSFEARLEQAMLKKKLQLPFVKFDKFNSPSWRPRRWEYLDPLKEMAAAQMAIALGIKSRQKIVDESNGSESWEEIEAELKYEKDKMKADGLESPEDLLSQANAALMLAQADAAGDAAIGQNGG